MIQVYNNVLLMDFVMLALRMPDDERQQLEQFTGLPYDVDGCALGNYTAEGPKWVIKDDEHNLALVAGGFAPQRPGVWRDFLLTSPEAWSPKYAFSVTRICRRIMDAMFISKQAHRIECIVPERRILSRPELVRWYKVLGYKQEATLQGYCADGYPAVVFSRVGR